MKTKPPGGVGAEGTQALSHLLHYRCYLLDGRGSIRRGSSLQCADDREAFLKAMELCRGQPFEVWQGVRQVHVFPPRPEKEEF